MIWRDGSRPASGAATATRKQGTDDPSLHPSLSPWGGGLDGWLSLLVVAGLVAMTDFGGVIAHTALVRPATRAGAATYPPHA